MTQFIKKAFPNVFRFVEGNYNLLLMFLVLLFILRPYDYANAYVVFWKILFVSTIIFAVFNGNHPKNLRIIIFLLGIPAVLSTFVNVLHSSPLAITATTASTILFLAVCAGSILRDVIVKARVTLETLRGAVCTYFLIAFLFAYIYLFLETLNPGTILIRGEVYPVFPKIYYFYSEMLYYSFVTLLTIGFGDIVSNKDLGQTATVVEGILGQLYIAILISRLVAVYSFISNKEFIKSLKE